MDFATVIFIWRVRLTDEMTRQNWNMQFEMAFSCDTCTATATYSGSDTESMVFVHFYGASLSMNHSEALPTAAFILCWS